MISGMKKFLIDDSGASMVEYGIALLVVAALGVGVMQQIGGATAISVGDACDAVQGIGVNGNTVCG